ncbi:HEPN domain-containing protein [Rhizobium leguminosarum]|uniref:HEPN domain-containing protein n=1 Tax=Rhizobium leguminosarum TaxID=384 RepID=UPI001C9656F7|nr:HEPN domain-containing protein [Rhizobium leguminosarum]MBY5741784.1 hypothetical protein [Rhizobium leguminosarum]
MSALPEFNRRFADIKQILETLRDMEKRLKGNPRSHLQRSRLVASSRASAYVMMYNAIESAMREVFNSMRSAIEAEQLQPHSVSEFWRLDILQSKFLRKMQDGFSHGTVLTNIVPVVSDTLQWTEAERGRLPFSGNFGQDHVFRFKDVLGIVWSAPPGTLGGADLENIRKRRNALAHGLETFEEAGASVTAKELLDTLDRVNRFMASYISALETYQSGRGYVNLVPLPAGLSAGLLESRDSS